MTDDFKHNVTRVQTWQRLLYILLFAFFYTVAEFVIAAVVLVQFGFEVITGKRNRNVLELGAGLSRYAYEVLLYVTYNSDQRPFPFSDWPAGARPEAAPRKGSRASSSASPGKSRSRSASKKTAAREKSSDESSSR